MTQTRLQQESPAEALAAPRLADGKPLLIAGLSQRFSSEARKDIPGLWARFASYIDNVPGQIGRVAYGVTTNSQSEPFYCDYLAGVEVSGVSGLPSEFIHVSIPAQKYIVFTHRQHVSSLSQTLDPIAEKWLPSSGHEPVQAPGAPTFFERYGETFDPQTGLGGIEVWIPIKA